MLNFKLFSSNLESTCKCMCLTLLESIIEGLPAKRAYIAFLADFFIFLQDQANFWQTDLC